VVVGIILIIVGLFMISYLGVIFDVSTNRVGIFSPQVMGLGLMGIGFLAFIAGLAASPSERMVRRIERTKPTPTQKTVLLAICPKCKTRVLFESKFCPECGEDLRKT